jgi:hypothetical protein
MKLRILALALVLALSGSCASTKSLGPDFQVDLTDAAVPQGGVTVFHASGGGRVVGGGRGSEGDGNDGAAGAGGNLFTAFSGGEVYAVESGDTAWGAWGILAVDLETPPGSYELTLIRDGVFIRKTIEVKEWDYGIERLKLPKEMVELDKKTLKRVAKEAALIKKLWAGSERRPLFTTPFVMPIEGRVSGKFGTRRILNGSPRSPHSGMDFAAPKGTPVKAANSGRVAFIGDFFFKGRFVVIDHGLGVFTAYNHLSEVLTEKGQLVTRGEVIGEVGSSGRATGAHLHFSVMVGGMRVSPTRLFEVTERVLPDGQLLPRASLYHVPTLTGTP